MVTSDEVLVENSSCNADQAGPVEGSLTAKCNIHPVPPPVFLLELMRFLGA